MIRKRSIIFLIFLIGIISSYSFFEFKYNDKIYPGIYIGNVDLGGKTFLEAEDLINSKLDKIYQEGITFSYEDREMIIYPISSSSDASVVDILIDFKVKETINEAMALGHTGNIVKDSIDKFKPFFAKKHQIELINNFNIEKIINYLKESFSIFNPEDARYYFDNNILLIYPGEMGKSIDYSQSMFNLKNNLNNLNSSTIFLEGHDASPEISESDCLNEKEKMEEILNLSPIKLKYSKKEWIIDKEILLSLVTLSKEESLLINLDKEKIEKYIKENVSLKINQKALAPKFTFTNEVFENFEPGQEGRELDIDLTVELLSKLIESPFKELNLSVKEFPVSDNFEKDANNLGIKEVLAKYSLGFEGSTEARTTNIKNGAKALNGLLIKPGEEFSMIKSLGSIDEANGYLKEAVIRGDAIYYEYGGGLCHTSTTLFRTVLNAGLPITMRQNHSYNMPYYEPAGIDATIYDPYPDFRFINDTNNYILIQAEVINQELFIELWGKKDGRTIERTEPYIYNIVKPLPTKIIKTYTLKSGQMKCTYSAYNGADAYFDYIVTYPDSTIKSERFKSHYIPRQGVCLVGI